MKVTKRIATADCRKTFADISSRVGSGAERVRVTRYGKTLVGIVSAKDLQRLEECEQRSAEDDADDQAQRRRRKRAAG